jgi:competence protein ComEA
MGMLRQQRDLITAIAAVLFLMLGLLAWVSYSRLTQSPPMQVVGPSDGTLPALAAPSPAKSPPPSASGAKPPPTTLRIHLVGAVHKSGVYTLPPGSRVDDAVQMAGGATADADLERINLADFLSDGEQVRIPRKSERRPTPPLAAAPHPARPSPPVTPAPAPNHGTGRYPLDDNGAPRSGAGSSLAPGPAATPGGKVNLNTATAAELDTLPGVGPATATSILEFRREHGRFLRIEDIMEVRGIGVKKFETMKERLAVK